jgi:hypothetical protein
MRSARPEGRGTSCFSVGQHRAGTRALFNASAPPRQTDQTRHPSRPTPGLGTGRRHCQGTAAAAERGPLASDPITTTRRINYEAPARGGPNPSVVSHSRFSADDSLPKPASCTRSSQLTLASFPTGWRSRASSLRLADALCRRLRCRLREWIAILLRCRLAIAPSPVDVKSLAGFGAYCPEARLLLLLGGNLALGRRLLLRGGLRLRCLLHHVALLVRA